VSAGAATWTGHELAVEGAVTPDHGGPVEQRLVLFDPDRLSWRVSSKPPTEVSSWPFLIPGTAAGHPVIVGMPPGSPPPTSNLAPSGSPGPAGRPGGQENGTTLIYDPVRDSWRSAPAPFQNAMTLAELTGGRLAEGAPDLFILDPAKATWSTAGAPPGPPVNGSLVATGAGAFVFGITTSHGLAAFRSPNGAYLWTP
jgi:hypothetical protein